MKFWAKLDKIGVSVIINVTLAILKVLEVGIFEHFAQVGEILNVANEEIRRDM